MVRLVRFIWNSYPENRFMEKARVSLRFAINLFHPVQVTTNCCVFHHMVCHSIYSWRDSFGAVTGIMRKIQGGPSKCKVQSNTWKRWRHQGRKEGMEGEAGKRRKTGTKRVEGKELNEAWFEGTKARKKTEARKEARGRKENTWLGEKILKQKRKPNSNTSPKKRERWERWELGARRPKPPGAHPFWCRIPVGCRLDTSFRPLEFMVGWQNSNYILLLIIIELYCTITKYHKFEDLSK